MRGMPSQVLQTVYTRGILPSILYGILVWGNSSSICELNKIHIRAARFVMKLSKKKIKDELVLDKAQWKPLQFYYKRAVACKAYKIYYEKCSPRLTNLICKNNTRRTRNELKLDVLSYKYSIFKKSFSYRAPNVWNNIPNDTRKKSYDMFKSELTKSDHLHKITFGSCATSRAIDYANYIYY